MIQPVLRFVPIAIAVALMSLTPATAEAISACGYPPPPVACISWQCQPDGQWGEVFRRAGTACGNQGKCDGQGDCIEPPIISGKVYPKWMVSAVYYAPPGSKLSSQGSTFVYGAGSTTGVGMTEEKSYKNSVSYTDTTKLGFLSSINGQLTFSIGNDYGNTDAKTKDWIETYTSAMTVPGPTSVDGIDHSQDWIELWLNPEVTIASQGTLISHSTGYKSSDPTAIFYQVQLGWLLNPATMPLQTYNYLVGILGIPLTDFAEMAKADPYSNPAYVIDSNRFVWLTYFDYEAAPCGSSPLSWQRSWTQAQSTTSTTLNEVTMWASITISGEADFLGFVAEKFAFTDRFAFTHRSSQKTSTGSNQSVTVNWRSPSCYFTGGVFGNVYVDMMYHTYMVDITNQVGP